jgi:uncharacterized SAM-binding protein YcdF (DUF218 family)
MASVEGLYKLALRFALMWWQGLLIHTWTGIVGRLVKWTSERSQHLCPDGGVGEGHFDPQLP